MKQEVQESENSDQSPQVGVFQKLQERSHLSLRKIKKSPRLLGGLWNWVRVAGVEPAYLELVSTLYQIELYTHGCPSFRAVIQVG